MRNRTEHERSGTLIGVIPHNGSVDKHDSRTAIPSNPLSIQTTHLRNIRIQQTTMSTPVRIPTASASSRTREGSSSGSSGSPTSLTSSSASSSYDSPTHISTGRRQSFLNPLHAEQSFKIYDLGPADRAAPVVVLSASQVGLEVVTRCFPFSLPPVVDF
ncbi:hypothetical protein G7K_0735-t1 [Saitoella complicata NRRL Y-17804]|uniref:Uncharacterized protein n=1 Tax=Saitoella complicata (strain BCRC 22490 / CBS 7301 / JCM 7358 / NBRC 10748 / NRRL Y-17804) TaxID=698492 RepID=A0A0E9NAR9_SAICN|nr:hypothetical protein G7K_0735-t1 [Saitoella complicata NRRL Y-17804]